MLCFIRKGRKGQSVIDVGGQAEKEEGTKVRWTEGRRGSRWVWKCVHLPRCRDRNRATSLEKDKNTTQKRAIPTLRASKCSASKPGSVSKQIHLALSSEIIINLSYSYC